MNLQAYIESGILSIYVLGVASEEEKQDVERMAALYPELKAELVALESSMEQYACQYETIPPPSLKKSIFEQIATLELQQKPTQSKSNFVPSQTNFFSFKYGVAAAVVLLILSIGTNVFLYQRWQNTEDALSLALNSTTQMANNMKVMEAKYEATSKEMAMMENPTYTKTKLEGDPENAPKSKAMLYWNPQEKEAYIISNSLPQPPEGKQYQLWAVEDGIVWDAGVFELGQMNKVKCFKKPQKFVITLEKRGGVPKAEGKMYAISS